MEIILQSFLILITSKKNRRKKLLNQSLLQKLQVSKVPNQRFLPNRSHLPISKLQIFHKHRILHSTPQCQQTRLKLPTRQHRLKLLETRLLEPLTLFLDLRVPLNHQLSQIRPSSLKMESLSRTQEREEIQT